MLARDLGMTVGELMNRLSYAEWSQWVEYYEWEARMKGAKIPRTIAVQSSKDAVAALDRYAIPAMRAKCRGT
jgi:hypothetical protein